jgi:hypothetical protein
MAESKRNGSANRNERTKIVPPQTGHPARLLADSDPPLRFAKEGLDTSRENNICHVREVLQLKSPPIREIARRIGVAPRARSGGLPLFLLLRAIPSLGEQALDHDAPDPIGRRQAVDGLRRHTVPVIVAANH